MYIKFAILGFLSLQPMSGYDLKKMFSDSQTVYWAGNNNQIYRTLVDLHKDELVTREVVPQENYPARKVYTLTAKGREVLRQGVLSKPELPQLKHTFLIQLTWADQLSREEINHLLEEYENEVVMELLLALAPKQQEMLTKARTPREAYLWDMIHKNNIRRFEDELNWVRQLRQDLNDQKFLPKKIREHKP